MRRLTADKGYCDFNTYAPVRITVKLKAETGSCRHEPGHPNFKSQIFMPRFMPSQNGKRNYWEFR